MKQSSREIRSGCLAAALVLLFAAHASAPARGLFHIAVIDEIMTSYDGDANVQFVEIRMLIPAQNFVTNSVLGAFDSSGSYIGDVFIVPADVANSGAEVRWLMATEEFEALSGLTADFTFTPGLPTDGGMVCWGAPGILAPDPASWDHTDPAGYVDCIAYGSYNGPSNLFVGTPTSLDADGRSLVRISETDDNAVDFACSDPAGPENNLGEVASVTATSSCVQGPQSKAQQGCINALNKDGAKVAATQGKENSSCVKNAGKGKVADAQSCLTADGKGKVTKAGAKTQADFDKKCGSGATPDFGVPGVFTGTAEAVNAAAIEESVALVGDVFGAPLDDAVVGCGDDKAGCGCQATVIKDYEKVAATKIKTFLKCKKVTLKGGATDAGALEECITGPGSDSIRADAKGKIAKTVTKLQADIGKKCIANLFPGDCSAVELGRLAACLEGLVDCRVCGTLNGMDDLRVDCDTFDDGSANGSCASGSHSHSD